MNRYLVENLLGIPGFNIAWYGVIIGAGIILGLLMAMYRAKKQMYKPDIVLDLIIIALPIAIICARLYYVIFEWDQYAGNLIKIFAINEGGLAIYGGVIGGFLTALVFSKINRFPLLVLVDLLIPSLVLGQAIGRWGNFVNQEAFGNLITNPKMQFFPVGVYIDRLAEWHQATFFYESTWNFCLLIVLLIIGHRVHKPGILLSTYFMGYGLARLIIEGLRTDSLYIVPGIRISQVLSFVLILIGLVMTLILIKRDAGIPEYTGKYRLHLANDHHNGGKQSD